LRLDKFLKISLIFKTRSSGEKTIEEGNVLINDKMAKPSSNIKIGDILTIRTSLKKTNYKILQIAEKNVSKKDARELYEILNEEHYEI
jgi:ribosomal 50S subunit-recycling heat shock protein